MMQTKAETELNKLETFPQTTEVIKVDTPQAPSSEELLRRLALRRLTSVLSLIAALGLFFVWLPEPSRRLLLRSIASNQIFIVLTLVFALVAVSLTWTIGQRFDVWLFKSINIRQISSVWIDRLMWICTQIGSVFFAVIVSVIAYIGGERQFAIYFTVGSLTLLLLITVIKAFTDRARPFKLLNDARVVGWKAIGLSFPSGHTAQTFFMMTLVVRVFAVQLPGMIVLYAIALLVGVTRVYLGVHYPRDVAAGAAIGAMWGVLATLVSPFL